MRSRTPIITSNFRRRLGLALPLDANKQPISELGGEPGALSVLSGTPILVSLKQRPAALLETAVALYHTEERGGLSGQAAGDLHVRGVLLAESASTT